MLSIKRRHALRMGGAAVAAVAIGGAFGRQAARTPDAIVVGAGATGCNVAWHLLERGHSVLVLEANAGPATQASHNAAGFVAHWSAVHVAAWGRTEWQMQHYGINFYTRHAASAAKAGSQTGFVASGIAYIYRSPAEWIKVQPRIQLARQFGTRLEILSAECCKTMLPQIDFSRVAGIAFDPDSVRVRAADMIPSLAEETARRGAEFRYDEPVLELIPGGVRTAKRDYLAKSVIVTAGAWSRPLLEKAGKRCPANPVAEIRYTTKPLAAITPDMPLLIFSDYGFYIREERGGLLIGGGDPEPALPDRRIDPSHPPWAAALNLTEAHRVRRHITEIEDIMPALKEAEIDVVAGGIPTFTSDLHFIADAVPGSKGLFVIAGCQEAGITHGPALGLMMSELVSTGKTSIDRQAFRLSRFADAAAKI